MLIYIGFFEINSNIFNEKPDITIRVCDTYVTNYFNYIYSEEGCFITAYWKAIAGFFEGSDNHPYIAAATLKQELE